MRTEIIKPTTKITELKERLLSKHRFEVENAIYSYNVIPLDDDHLIYIKDTLGTYWSKAIDETIRAVCEELRMEKLNPLNEWTTLDKETRKEILYIDVEDDCDRKNKFIDELNQNIDDLLSTITKTGDK